MVKENEYLFSRKDCEIVKLSNPERTNLLMINPRNSATRQFSMGITDIEAGSGTGEHNHIDEEEIMFCYKGRGFITIDGKEYDFNEETAAFVPKGVMHSFRNPYEETLSYIWIFSPPGFEQVLRDRLKE